MSVGITVGVLVGLSVGRKVGVSVGVSAGINVGVSLGMAVGVEEGMNVGVGVDGGGTEPAVGGNTTMPKGIHDLVLGSIHARTTTCDLTASVPERGGGRILTFTSREYAVVAPLLS